MDSPWQRGPRMNKHEDLAQIRLATATCSLSTTERKGGQESEVLALVFEVKKE